MNGRLQKLSVGFAAIAAILVATYGPAWSQESTGNYRLEISGGIQGGNPDIEFAGASDKLDTSTGFAVSGGLWVDKVGFDYLSLGLQFTHLGGADYNESAAATLFGVTLAANVEITHNINALMANAALRKNDGTLHPYVGGGVGVAFTDADITAAGTITVGGSTFAFAGTADDSDTSFAAQVFGGVDIDVTDNIYVGVNGRYFMTNADLFGADVKFRNYVAMGVVGFRF